MPARKRYAVRRNNYWRQPRARGPWCVNPSYDWWLKNMEEVEIQKHYCFHPPNASAYICKCYRGTLCPLSHKWCKRKEEGCKHGFALIEDNKYLLSNKVFSKPVALRKNPMYKQTRINDYF